MTLTEAMKRHLSTLSQDRRFAYAVRLLWGVPYVWGGEDILGTDCSGSVAWGLYLLGYGLRVTAHELYFNWTLPMTDAHPTAGHLCFFWAKTPPERIQHVAVFSDDFIIMDADRRFMDTPLSDEIARRQDCKFAYRRLNWDKLDRGHLPAWNVSPELVSLIGALA